MSQQPKIYSGEYVSEVVSVDDPKRMMRVQVRVYDIFDDVPAADLPWATYRLPLGVRPSDGGLVPVKVGDLVWVDFPFNGDTRRPRITGGVHHAPEGNPNMPPEAWAGPGQFDHKRTPDEPKPEAPGYHEDIVFQQNGVLVQLTKSGAARITNLASGTAAAITPDGVVVIHCEKDCFHSVQGNCLVDVKGNYTLRVGGGMDMQSQGPGTVQSQGNMTLGSAAESLNLSAAKEGTMTGPGGLAFSGPASFDKNVNIGGDANVSGQVIDGGGNTNHHSH